MFFSTLITIGARGRTFDRSGIHEGLAIVSQNNFINKIEELSLTEQELKLIHQKRENKIEDAITDHDDEEDDDDEKEGD